MSALRFSVLIIFFPILLGACGRSDLIRIRILSPISETKKDHTIFTDTSLSSTAKIPPRKLQLPIQKQVVAVYIFCLKASVWVTPQLPQR